MFTTTIRQDQVALPNFSSRILVYLILARSVMCQWFPKLIKAAPWFFFSLKKFWRGQKWKTNTLIQTNKRAVSFLEIGGLLMLLFLPLLLLLVDYFNSTVWHRESHWNHQFQCLRDGESEWGADFESESDSESKSKSKSKSESESDQRKT